MQTANICRRCLDMLGHRDQPAIADMDADEREFVDPSRADAIAYDILKRTKLGSRLKTRSSRNVVISMPGDDEGESRAGGASSAHSSGAGTSGACASSASMLGLRAG
eukprot:1733987-Prymnesium_polylepis.1